MTSYWTTNTTASNVWFTPTGATSSGLSYQRGYDSYVVYRDEPAWVRWAEGVVATPPPPDPEPCSEDELMDFLKGEERDG